MKREDAQTHTDFGVTPYIGKTSKRRHRQSLVPGCYFTNTTNLEKTQNIHPIKLLVKWCYYSTFGIFFAFETICATSKEITSGNTNVNSK